LQLKNKFQASIYGAYSVAAMILVNFNTLYADQVSSSPQIPLSLATSASYYVHSNFTGLHATPLYSTLIAGSILNQYYGDSISSIGLSV
jgi:hypothetical protein